MSDHSQRITELSPEKRELLLRRLRQGGGGGRQQLRPQGRATRSFPPSFAQQRLWFLSQLQPDSPFYNVPDNFRLTGRLDAAALERSFGEIVRRHEVLRTTFDTVEGEPRQFINDPAPFRMPVRDLTGLPADALEAELFRLASEEAKRLFDLSRDPMLRASLLRLGDEDHVLLMTMHHIASDGWSRGVLVSELATLYAAYSEGRAPELPELPIQYADYAAWQREQLAGAALEEQLAYWRGRLGGELPALELPTDRPRPPIPTQRGAYYNFAFPERLGAGLRALSRESSTTLFMTLLAGFKTLLSRYTGQADIIVGTPVAGRSRSELEPLIGFFVNMLVLRTDLSGDPTFRELLRRVKQSALGAYAHQDLPFEKLVEELHPRRDMSRNPLFQVAFALQNAPAEDFSLSGLQMSPLDVGSGSSRFDIECHLWETPEGLGGGLIYSTDLFDETTIERMVTHYRQLLEGIIAAPDATLSDLPLLTASERRQIVVEWNQPRRPYPQNACLQQLFEAQAARAPEAVALIFGEGRITYAELNGRANRLAQRLRAAGVAPETLVGIMAERSPELVVGLLGVLKAGGAYVPLDPQYPQERLAFMLADACVPVLLSQKRLTARLPPHRARVLLLDADDEAPGAVDAENPECEASADNLAYVIYTSGSTGRPKGVAITHRNLAPLLAWAGEYFKLGPHTKVLQNLSFCFDFGVFELVTTLLAGGTLFFLDGYSVANSREYADFIRRHAINTVHSTPTIFREVIAAGGERLDTLELLHLGGEALTPRAVEEIFTVVRADCALHNGYGPTEASVNCAVYEVAGRDDAGWRDLRTIPIGRATADSRLYILDHRLRPVPVGVSGELFVGGPGLSRGYLNRPGLTARAFVPDPFSAEPGARLYRTGDLARYLPDGNIEFLGRADNQVKVRGFRIEPGEIEAALERHARVREAAVLAREDTPGDKRLVAYVVTRPGAALLPDELRGFLRESLPEHMIPSGFVLLDEMPLTANGKIDRQALQALSCPEAARRGIFVAPRDQLELQLAQVWEDVLKTRPVGVRDNFFDLGGHSLLAVRLMASLRQQLKRDLPLAALLQAQTIEDLARLLRRQEDAPPPSALVAIQPQGLKTPFFCVHPVGGGVLCYLELARQLDPERPFYGLQAANPGAETSAPRGIEEMAAFYLDALRGVQPEGPYLLGGWSMGGVVVFEMARQLQRRGERVALVALLDSHAPEAADTASRFDEETLFQMFAEDVGRMCGVELTPQDETPRGATLDERLGHLLRRAAEFDAAPAAFEPGEMRQAFSVFEANIRALARYVPREYPGRVTLFRAREQPAEAAADQSNGWRGLAAEGVELHVVEGNHYTMIRRPDVRALAERLNESLDAAPTRDHLWSV